MKYKVNRNFIWSEIFVKQLETLGVKFACISPGSRNTSLTLAFAANKKFKNYVIIDERSSAFFALGLAKRTQSPVVVVCTSGTAAVELFPAIVEAYQQRVPLIICTADRPPELQNVGANQAINQNNLYHNYVRWYCYADLPALSPKKLLAVRNIAVHAFNTSAHTDRGPVHINFPFRKPFEPNSFTDYFDSNSYPEMVKKDSLLISTAQIKSYQLERSISFKKVLKSILKNERGILVAGPHSFNRSNKSTLLNLSNIIGFPILADALSGLRFGKTTSKNLITNYDALLRSENFLRKFNPQLILHFGRTITSKGLEIFYENTHADKYLINEFGDCFDPAKKTKNVFAITPDLFCLKAAENLSDKLSNRNNSKWIEAIRSADKVAETLKRKIIFNSKFPSECNISNAVFKTINTNSSVMLSNSMPVRDLDYFIPKLKENIDIYFNRGASGIDGITSTSLGIASANNKPTFLITGDLSFYYDLNSLLIASQNKIPLIVILINNKGGGIFQVLPIASYKKVFDKYFLAKHDLDFSTIVKSFGCKHKVINSWSELNAEIAGSVKAKEFKVLEIITDAKKSFQLKSKFWIEVDRQLSK